MTTLTGRRQHPSLCFPVPDHSAATLDVVTLGRGRRDLSASARKTKPLGKAGAAR
jgi:hypothetical protein